MTANPNDQHDDEQEQEPKRSKKNRAEHHAELLSGLANQCRTSDQQPLPVFIDLARVMELTSRSKSAIYEDPTFPQPVSFNEPGVARRGGRWLLHEVEAWLQARIAERDAKAAKRRKELVAQRKRSLVRRRTTAAKRSAEADA